MSREIPEKKYAEFFIGNEWTLPTDEELVTPAREELMERLAEYGWEEEDCKDMGVGFSEALINAIVHGNLGIKETDKLEEESWRKAALRVQKEKPNTKLIHVTLDISSDSVMIVIRDEGEGFIPKNEDDITEEDLLKSSGRGGIFIKAYFDTVERNEKGNEITLKKKK